jgi:hypothetical protein
MINENSTVAEAVKFFARHNLSMHIRYYNDHKRLVSNQVTEITKELNEGRANQEREVDLKAAKAVYLNSYHQYMIINTFLLMYSHLEECLAVAFRILVEDGPATSRRTGLERFMENFRERCSVRLAEGPKWAYLQDCSRIRSTLLHAAGNITLVRDRQRIDSVIKRNPEYVAVDNDRLIVREKMLVDFYAIVPDFLDWLADAIEEKNRGIVGGIGS